MLDVCLLGTGGMFPLPGRALTSLYVRCKGHALLIDCGEGTQTAIRAAGLRFKPIDAILITHFHADHISGLPGLLLTMGNEGRTDPLLMFGPDGLENVVNSLRVIVPQLPFEVLFSTVSQCRSFSCAGLRIDAFEVDHGTAACLGYSINLDRMAKFDPDQARANGVPIKLWGRLQRGETADGYSPKDVLGAPRRGIHLLYATDSRPVPAMEQYARQADLLILEGMYGEAEKQERALESSHMTMQEAACIAKKVCAHELWLTHFSPATPEPELFSDEIQAIFPNSVIGQDGMKKTLTFPQSP